MTTSLVRKKPNLEFNTKKQTGNKTDKIITINPKKKIVLISEKTEITKEIKIITTKRVNKTRKQFNNKEDTE